MLALSDPGLKMDPLASLYIQGSDNKQTFFSGEYLRWELQEVNAHTLSDHNRGSTVGILI